MLRSGRVNPTEKNQTSSTIGYQLLSFYTSVKITLKDKDFGQWPSLTTDCRK